MEQTPRTRRGTSKSTLTRNKTDNLDKIVKKHSRSPRHYDTAFQLPEGASTDVYEFLQELDRLSVFATGQLENLSNFISGTVPKTRDSRYDTLLDLATKAPLWGTPDMTTVEDDDDLSRRLESKFTDPLLHRGSAEGSNLGLKDPLKVILEFVKAMRDAKVSVYEMTSPDKRNRTYEVESSVLVEHLETTSPTAERPPMNFLDIANATGKSFCPYSVVAASLDRRIAVRTRSQAGNHGQPSVSAPREFFIASTPGCVSTVHVDSGAANTWVLILHGRKIWYWPKTADEEAVRWLAKGKNDDPRGYSGGWVKVELCAGDLLVMPPSFPHAVFTPETCLAVGGQFYTSAELGRTLRGLRMEEKYPSISNETLSDETYESLSNILRNADGVLTREEVFAVLRNADAFDLAQSSDARDISGLTVPQLKELAKRIRLPFRSNVKKPELLELIRRSGGPDQRDATKRQEFLAALRAFQHRHTIPDLTSGVTTALGNA